MSIALKVKDYFYTVYHGSGRSRILNGSTWCKIAFYQPQTPNPKPQTPNPKPQTPNPKPQTPNPKPQTPNPFSLPYYNRKLIREFKLLAEFTLGSSGRWQLGADVEETTRCVTAVTQ